MPDRKQIPALPESTEANDNDLLIKRDVGSGTDERLPVGTLFGRVLLQENKTVRIPSDYATLQEAIDAESRFRPLQGVIITLLIEEGHELTAGVRLDNGNFGHFVIQSEDSEVLCALGFDGVTTLDIPDRDSGSNGNIIVGVGCHLPILDCVINANGNVSGGGYVVANGSYGRVLPGAGIVGVDRHGCHVFGRGSSVDAVQSVFTDSGLDNFRASLGGTINGQGADASRGGQSGAGNNVHITRTGTGHFQEATINDGGDRGVRCARGILNLTNAVCKNNQSTDVFYSEGSFVQAVGLETTNGNPAIQDFSGTGGTAFNWLTNAGAVFSSTGEAENRPGVVVGSNANGNFRVYPDGYAHCWKDITVDSSGLLQNFEFPIAINDPVVSFCGRGTSARPTAGSGGSDKRRAYIGTIVGMDASSEQWEVIVDTDPLSGSDVQDYAATLHVWGYVNPGDIVETE